MKHHLLPSQERLMIFTRYPEAGKTKTRLIPLLGEEGAADLQRQMTEETVNKVRDLQRTQAISLEIYFTGANLEKMRGWLGSDLTYQTQAAGDLGDRLKGAFRDAFSGQVERAVIMGVDCPHITEKLILEAFNALKSHQIVLGPATDGGYYLIGLSQRRQELKGRRQEEEIGKRLEPLSNPFRPEGRGLYPIKSQLFEELFQDIAWGTGEVLAQTVQIAEKLSIEAAYLPTLSDIDRPEDYGLWSGRSP